MAGATLWARFETEAGFVDPLGGPANIPPGFPDAEFVGVFDPTGGPLGGNDAGGFTLFASVVAGAMAGPPAPWLDSNFFVSSTPGVTADLRVEADTELNNPENIPGANPFGIGDWTVTSNDDSEAIYIVPEPMTMLAVGVALGGLGRYIRRRRTA